MQARYLASIPYGVYMCVNWTELNCVMRDSILLFYYAKNEAIISLILWKRIIFLISVENIFRYWCYIIMYCLYICICMCVCIIVVLCDVNSFCYEIFIWKIVWGECVNSIWNHLVFIISCRCLFVQFRNPWCLTNSIF